MIEREVHSTQRTLEKPAQGHFQVPVENSHPRTPPSTQNDFLDPADRVLGMTTHTRNLTDFGMPERATIVLALSTT
jgi:hypothetical protein